MTGDRESEGEGEAAGEGLDPDAVVSPRNGAPAADSDADAEGDADLEVPLPWNTVSDGDDESDAEAASGDDVSDDPDAPTDARPVPDEFEDLRFVGPKTAPILAESDVSIADVCEKRVSYRDLTTAGVNPGVAAKIRREHSLSWSLDGGGTDLDRRSSQIRGLDDDERAWIAESSGWTERADADAPTETDGSGDAAADEAAWRARTEVGDAASGADGTDDGVPETAGEAAWRAESGVDDRGESDVDGGLDADADAESAWRQRSAPTPLSAVEGFDEEVVTTLRKAGIGSVRRLATADPGSVADALELDAERVRAWRDRARDHESESER